MARKTERIRVTSPEKSKLINKNNKNLKKDFLSYLKSVQRSQGTIAGYDNDLELVFTYILDELDNKNFQNLTKRDIVSIQNWLVEKGNSPARIRRIKAAMSSLSNYCENILADDDPDFENYRSIVRKIENPPLQPVREKTIWKDEELEGLLNELVDRKNFEKACWLALAMYSGRRKAELVRFKVDDFNDDRLVCDNALYKSSPILTKGNKMLECYTLAKKFKPYLNLWIDERERLGVESEWLFPDPLDTTKHLDKNTCNSWAKTFTSIVGKDFYTHSLRHYYVTALVRAGIPDSVIVDIIGWSNAQMLSIYDDTPKEEKLSMYFKDGDIITQTPGGFSDM